MYPFQNKKWMWIIKGRRDYKMENQKKKHQAKRKNLETPCSGAVTTSTISAIFTV